MSLDDAFPLAASEHRQCRTFSILFWIWSDLVPSTLLRIILLNKRSGPWGHSGQQPALLTNERRLLQPVYIILIYFCFMTSDKIKIDLLILRFTAKLEAVSGRFMCIKIWYQFCAQSHSTLARNHESDTGISFVYNVNSFNLISSCYDRKHLIFQPLCEYWKLQCQG